jgi:hypothetical protein
MKLYLLLFFLVQSHAWWCNGHMITAMVSELDLLQRNPSAYKLANATVRALSGALVHGTSNSYVESACWADDIKEYSLTYLNYAHFYDTPYNPEGLLSTPTPIENILWTINQIDETLTTQTVQTAPLETSFSLRFLIHLIGDMHQPLHCAQLWSLTFPKGDAGGNFFKITYDSSINQLHKLWDSAIGHLKDDMKRPLNDAGWAFIKEYAQLIMEEYPRSSLQQEMEAYKTPQEWCQQSFEEAMSVVYSDIVQYERPSQMYLDRGWALVKKQIALAGYRLSDMVQGYY